MRLPSLLAKRIQFRYFLGWLCVLLWGSSCLAQRHSVRLQPTIIHDGLPNGAVYALLQDPTGFMWFGTHQGLSRFDGSQFKNFYFDPKNPTGLSSDNISTMIIGPEGDLWLGTWGGGINRMNLKTGGITHYRHKAGDRETISEDRILELFFDRTGMLWIGTSSGGLSKMDPATGICRRFTQSNAPNGLPDSRIHAFLEDLDGRLWIGTGRGLVLLDGDKDQFIPFMEAKATNDSKQRDIRALIQDREGTIWVGSQYGLGRLDMQKRRIEYFQPFQGHGAEMGQNVVNVLHEDRNGRLWVGLASGGLCQFDRRQSNFLFVLQIGGQIIDDVRDIREDNNGNIWVGTRGAGARIFNPRLSYAHYSHDPLNNNSLSHNRPRTFTQDGFGKIWIGTEFGLNCLDAETEDFERFTANPSQSDSLPSNLIRAVVEDRDGTLWVGTINGLAYRSVGNQGFRTLRKSLNDPQSLINNQVQCLFEDLRGSIWVGTQDGLSKLDKATLRFKQFRFDPDEQGSLSHQSIQTLAEDLRGDLWVGTMKGLNRIRNGDITIEHHFHDPKRPTSISHNTIYAIHNSQTPDDDNLWIATHYGLNSFDPLSGKARAWFKEDGLPSNQIHGVQSDRNGNLWISTNHGLAIFNIRDNRFSNFTVEHGIQANYFFPGSSFKDNKGRIYFGGINGFNSFNPEFYSRSRNAGTTVLTQTVLDDNPISQQTVGPDVSISHSIEIQYALLDFTKAKLNSYQTRMIGLQEEWQEQGTVDRVSFQNLKPATYLFEVRGRNSEGMLSEDAAKLRIKVVGTKGLFKPTNSRLIRFQWFVIATLTILLIQFWRGLAAVKSVAQPSPETNPIQSSAEANSGVSTRTKNSGAWLLPNSRHDFKQFKGSCKILLIDGELKNHLSLDNLLGNCGFEVVCIDQGHLAGMAVHRESPDLVLLDALLPDMDGMQLARLLRQEHPTLPILVGINDNEDLCYSTEQQAFCSELLNKPMQSQALLERIAIHCQISFEKTASS